MTSPSAKLKKIKAKKPGWELELPLWQAGFSPVAGLDEAGRGALAGPVVAAAVVLPFYEHYPFRDSKKLSAQRREQLTEQIQAEALAWAIGLAGPEEIDRFNVLKATHLAAQRALLKMKLKLGALVTDYLKLEFPGPVLAPPKADDRSFQVAAASILAKTSRDCLMRDYAALYPDYGFAENKGYGSLEHLTALDIHGPCAIHRRSFKPVAQGRLFSC